MSDVFIFEERALVKTKYDNFIVNIDGCGKEFIHGFAIFLIHFA